MSNHVEFNQELVNTYFTNWIGVSAINTEDYEKGPSVFGLYFPDRKTASISYVFLQEWQKWKPELPMILSVVQESENQYSFYIYKENRDEYVKGTFDHNLDTKELEIFLENEIDHVFVIIARFPDADNNIVDNPSQHFMTLKNLKYKRRSEVKSTEIENN
ncbi:hypothetical protein [Flagellimonas aurea]|uniref:hypothetical protein n=1 Tax=Flagellimonas aurea TaxID=2915619 RepID=UPI0035CEFFF9